MTAMSVRSGIGQLLNDGEHVQTLLGCPNFGCWWVPHTHIAVGDGAEALEDLDGNLLEIRHRKRDRPGTPF